MGRLFELFQYCYTCVNGVPYYNDPPEKQRRLCKCKIKEQGEGILAKVYNDNCKHYKMKQSIRTQIINQEQLKRIRNEKIDYTKTEQIIETKQQLSSTQSKQTI